MISCYGLLAVYLSMAGALDVANLDHSYYLLKENRYSMGQVSYTKKGKDFHDTYFIVDKSAVAKGKNPAEERLLDKCELKGRVYYGTYNSEEIKK